MMILEDMKAGALIQGIEPGEVVRIVTREPIKDFIPMQSVTSACLQPYPSICRYVGNNEIDGGDRE